MDRDELIARLLWDRMRERLRGHRGRRVMPPWDDALPEERALYLSDATAILAALESRPAPTEERVEAAIKFTYPDRDLRLNPVQETEREYWRPLIAAILATDTTPSRDNLELLKDPTAVHLNMLRGGIGKPSHAQIWHIYGAALAKDMPADVRAAVAPSRDEEGSVDREAVLEEAAQVAESEQRRMEAIHKDFRRTDAVRNNAWSQAVASERVAFAIRALKTSTPETQTVEGGGQ